MNFLRFLLLSFSFVVLNLLSNNGVAQDESPSKAGLIQTLKEVFTGIQNREFEQASQHLVLPPDFKPEMLSELVERRELSMEGILRLEKEATFGKAAELFEAKRLAILAERAEVPIDQCFGFRHEHNGVIAEVLGVWDSGQFKLFRFDDVGKLQPLEEAGGPRPQQQNLADRLPELEKAANDHPDSVEARARYAQALFQAGNHPAAWRQLVDAYKLQPNHAGVAKGMGALVQAFSEQDLFTVGLPMESLAGVLGDPSQKVELGKDRERWVYGFVAADFRGGRLHEVLDLRGMTEKAFKPTEVVTVDLGQRGWRCGHRRKNRSNVAAFYFLPGESLGNWTEHVIVERILDGASIGTTEKLAEAVAAQFKKRNRATRHKVLVQDESSVTLALMIPAEDKSENQNMLVRYLIGPVDVHRLAVTIKGDDPSRETQEAWLKIFQSAKLKKIGPPETDK